MALPKLNHPTFDLEIPSKKTKIKFRPMLVREEKILLMAKQSGQYGDILTAIKQVVNNCVLEKKFDIDKVTMFDLEWLFLKLRAMSVNNIAKVAYQDAQDGKVYDFDIDLEKIEIKMPAEIDNTVKVNSTLTIIMKYPEAALYSDPKFAQEQQDIDYFLIKTIDKIVDEDKIVLPELEEEVNLKEFIANLPLPAYEKIKTYWAGIPHLYHKIEYENSLGNKREIVLSTLNDFFSLV
jgi:hypothetical protein